MQYGDTLYSIASRYHTTVWNIMSINGLQSFWIYAGSTLRVPCESNDGGGNCSYRAAYIAEYREKFANPYVAAEWGYIDDVIEPKETRPRLINALEMLQNKRDSNPPKKHGNIPL